jgi:cytochrome oxidase Cu insertion factor (SCO1/SenC/PrrC family)
MIRARLTLGLLCLSLAACGSSGGGPSAIAGVGSGSASVPGGGSAGRGTVFSRPIPSSLLHISLIDQHRHRVSLATWHGRTVLLVPFLTLCQDVCPLTTGNLVGVQNALQADGASHQVQIVELTVDPGRDSPARLAAYARLTGARWELVTESGRDLRRLSKFFGFYYQRVPEDEPAGIDWWTGKKLTYDVDHSDNYFVINPQGVLRVSQDAAPDFHGHLNPRLYHFLDALGRKHLAHAPNPDWTPVDALDALSVTVGRQLRGP